MEQYDLRFGVLSDTHTIEGMPEAYALPDRLARALEWYNTQPGVNTLAISGDVSYQGEEEHWESFYRTWNRYKGNLELVPAMGNHDSDRLDGTTTAFDRFRKNTGKEPLAHYVISDYHFITVSPGLGTVTDTTATTGAGTGAIATARSAASSSSGGGDMFDSAVKNWLRKRIDIAKNGSPEKPIFIFVHHPLRNTCYVSDIWYTTSFAADASKGENPLDGFFRDDPQVVIFSGHIHSSNNDPRSIWQGYVSGSQRGFTSVNVPSIYYYDLEAGRLGRSPDGTGNCNTPKNADWITGAGQGLIVSVKGPKVKIENFDFDTGEGPRPLSDVAQIPQTWEFDVSKPQEFPYTDEVRKTQKTAPVFDAGAEVRVLDVGETWVEVNFDQAKMPSANPGNEVMHTYCFELVDKNTGNKRTVSQWSDFMLAPRLQKPTYTQLIGGLNAKTEYEMRIYACASFGSRSAGHIATAFTTLAPVL
jgi:hypothetical protein